MNESRLKKEIDFCNKDDFPVGRYLYMAMLKINGNPHVIAVAYKINYAIKKADSFLQDLNEAHSVEHDLNIDDSYYINKVLVGELDNMDRFYLNE